MTNKKIIENDYIVLGIIGCLLGILSFLFVYGTKIINFTYDGWLMNDGMDLMQHYVGWCHYRNTPWQFPLGLINSLSEPFSMSVVYTDSIPLFAVIFKLFSRILPVRFQYFGLFGLLCFALQGALSAILIRIFTNKKVVCILGSLLFIFSFPLLQRMFYHTALGAQWIILLALIIWFTLDLNNTKRSVVIWGVLGFFCVSIHSYFVFMTGIILILSVVEFYVTNKQIKKCVVPVVSFIICSFINLYLLGGFYGESNVSGYGFGLFNANLTAFINPLDHGTVFEGMKLYNDFEYEGFAYLGAGVLIVLLALFICVIAKKIVIPLSIRKKLIISGIIFSSFIAIFPNFDFAGIKIIHIPLPGIINSILGICRTNGRFMWIAYYLILLSVIAMVAPYIETGVVPFLVSVAIVIQGYDLSGEIKEKHHYYREETKYESVWTQFESLNLFENKDKFVFLYNDGDIMMDTALYAYLHNMSQNIFYYARPIDESVNNEIECIKKDISDGKIDESAIYILRYSDVTDDILDDFKKCDAIEYYFENHMIFSK